MVQTQSAPQSKQNFNNNRNEHIILDQLYFSDNRPGSPKVQGQNNNIANQHSTQDSYLQVASKNNEHFTTENLHQYMNLEINSRNPIQLSTELQPPPLNNIYNYNANNNSNYNLNLKQGDDGKDDGINRPFQNISLAITNFGINLMKVNNLLIFIVSTLDISKIAYVVNSLFLLNIFSRTMFFIRYYLRLQLYCNFMKITSSFINIDYRTQTKAVT